MSTETKVLYDKVIAAFDGHQNTDAMEVLTAITAFVLYSTMRTGVTLDDAMALFKKQVGQRMDLLAQQEAKA